MYRFWKPVIKPIFSILKPRIVVEIGSEHGNNTKNFLEYCQKYDATLHSIDPLPKFDVSKWSEEYENMAVFHVELSLNALPKIDRMDVVLIDGDHNWYTVFNELKLIEKGSKRNKHPFPLVLFHDIGWPYGRRDLYYNPDNIPEAYRKPYKKLGIKPGNAELAEQGGLNSDLYNAIYENDLQNGVLTAVEDFMEDVEIDLELIKIPAISGLGILFPVDLRVNNPDFWKFMESLQASSAISALMEQVESVRINSEIARYEIKEIKAIEVDQLRGQVSKLEQNQRIAENELIQLRSDIETSKETFFEKDRAITDLTNRLADVVSERDDLKRMLKMAEISANQLQKKIKSSQAEKIRFEQPLKEMEGKANAIHRVCELLDSQIKVLQTELESERDKVAQYDCWLRELKRDIRDIFTSLRWKVGNKVAFAFELLLLRLNTKTAKNHIEEILNEYDAFLVRSRQSIQVLETCQMSKEVATRWGSFCCLALAALRNPTQTIRMLDAERLKNLYITMFKQSPYVRENIFDYYMKLYGESTSGSVQDLFARTDYTLSHDEVPSLPQTDNPLVTIIIPVYNQWEYTERCVRSVLHSAEGFNYEIILADDNSTDETVNAAVVFPGIKVVKTPENYGFLKNCNNAALYAKGNYLTFLNNDTIVHENWLQAMLEVMEKDSSVGMTGSKFVYPDGKLQEAGGIIWQDASGWNFGRFDDPEKPEYNYVKEVDYISGASIMVCASLWNEIGGFDERYAPAYYEDADLAFEVRARGYKVVYTPFSVVTHFEGQSHGTDETSGIKKYQAINNKTFVEKWGAVLERDHFHNGKNIFQARDRGQNKKTMLVIDHYVPQYDKDAGSRSTYQYLQWFVECGLNVKFLGDNFYPHEPYTSELQQQGVEVLYGPWYANNWQQWLKENGNNINYIYLMRPHIALKYIDIARSTSKAKLIYFGHDLHYLRTERQYQIEKNVKLKKLADELRKEEFAIFEKVDVIYYPSLLEEAEVKKHFPDKCVRAIPLFIYDTISVEESRFDERRGLMFIGGFGHPPNLDALSWFIKEVFPKIVAENNSIRFIVVGNKIPAQVYELSSENIVIAGEVSDSELDTIYSQSRVSVVPLRYGAGIQGKILEALCKQIPVVTTDIGAEGMPEPVDCLKIANSPDEFARKVLELYVDKDEWHKQVIQGVEYLNRCFSKQRAREIWTQDVEFNCTSYV